MNTTLTGLAMLGGALMASRSGDRPRATIIVGKIADGRWMATVTGDASEYLLDKNRLVMAETGHAALKKMAEGFRREGYLEGLGSEIPTRTPWLGARFYARMRGRGQRRPRGQSRLGESWSSQAPMTKAERARVAKKCGARCFAGPNRTYPMCKKSSEVCGVDCKGARAAFSRARQYDKPKIALKAARAGKRAGCKWVRGKVAQRVLKEG